MATDPRDYSTVSEAEVTRLIKYELGSRGRLSHMFTDLHDGCGWTWARIGAVSGLHLTTVRRIARDPTLVTE